MKREGVALILVLVVTALLSLLVIEFAYIMRADTRVSEYRQNDRKAYHLGRGGVILATHVLRMDSPLVDSLNDIWAGEFPPVEEEHGMVNIRISDEDGKINVNRLVNESGGTDADVHGMLGRLLEITGSEAAADSVASELLARDGGAFFTKKEILDIPGAEGIFEYATIYTDGKININTASETVLEALSGSIDSALAKEIVSYRESSPFGSLSQLARVPGVSEEVMREISALAKVSSDVFTIEVSVSSCGRVKNIVSVVRRSGDDIRVLYWRAV